MDSFRGITVSRRDDELIAVKRADPDDPGRRRAEAELLARLDHPGVVEFVAFVDGDPAELQTRYVGTDTWSRVPPTLPDRAIAGLAAVTATVADLHDLDICHGALRAEHVVAGSDQRPILCGFADARPFDPSDAIADLVGLAGVIRDTAAALPDHPRLELEALARRATAGELSARDLSSELATLAAQPTTAPDPPWRRLRIAGPALAGIAVALVAVAGLRSGGAPATATAPTTAPSSTSLLPTTLTAAPTPSSTTVAVAAPTSDPAIQFTHEGRRYGLGAPGDVAVLGDWDCDGVATPALLQRSEAMVAVFDEWPDHGSTVSPTAMAPAPGATGLETVEHDGCDQLRILEPDGSRLFTPET